MCAWARELRLGISSPKGACGLLDSSFWVFGLWIATPLCTARDDDKLESKSLDSKQTCSRLDLGDKNGALQGESKART